MMNLKELNAGGGKVEILVPNLKKKKLVWQEGISWSLNSLYHSPISMCIIPIICCMFCIKLYITHLLEGTEKPGVLLSSIWLSYK